jgi:hypothetical protein
MGLRKKMMKIQRKHIRCNVGDYDRMISISS